MAAAPAKNPYLPAAERLYQNLEYERPAYARARRVVGVEPARG